MCITFGSVAVLRARVSTPSVRVGAVAVGEGEIVVWVELVFVLAVGAGRHGEAVVEHAIARSGDHRHDAVEHAASVQVGVETFVQEQPQQASALRVAPGDGVLQRGEPQFRDLCGQRDVVRAITQQ
jgi:hypothetical protein